MSDSISVKINCFHSGVFKNDEDGNLNYVDGLLEQFEVNGDAAYEEVLKIIVQKVRVGRMWYKLPYEDITEKKELLENGEKNKKRMASNGRYYGELDVFIENSVAVDGDEFDAENEAVDGDEFDAENEAVDSDEFDAEQQDDEDNGDHEAEESEDEYQASDKSDNEEDIDRNFQEDLEMFRDENYEDEILDEDEVYPDTEQSSGDEEEQAERMVQRGELDGIFSLRQTFYSGKEFKNQGLYSNGLKRVNGPRFWEKSGGERIEAPPYKRPPGRPKGKARIKGVNESPKKNATKVNRKGRVGHCGLCGGEGHNSRKCPHESEESRKRRRLNMQQQSQEQAIEDISSTAPPTTQT